MSSEGMIAEWLKAWDNKIHHLGWVVRIFLFVKLPIIESMKK